MDVRSSSGIEHRFDSRNGIAPHIRRRGPVSLEVIITGPIGPVIPDIVIATIRIALPNLDLGSRDRASVSVEDASGNSRDKALSWPRMSGNMDQIVVRILRKAEWVKRAGDLLGSGIAYFRPVLVTQAARRFLQAPATHGSACVAPALSWHVVSMTAAKNEFRGHLASRQS